MFLPLMAYEIVFIWCVLGHYFLVFHILAEKYFLEIVLQFQPIFTGEITIVICDVNERILHIGLVPNLGFKQGLKKRLFYNFSLSFFIQIVVHLAQLDIVEREFIFLRLQNFTQSRKRTRSTMLDGLFYIFKCRVNSI